MEQSLIFGDVNSSDYGIFISGAGVFNAPKRDVETFSIPGRNGDFLLDRNRFENITVTYPAHCKAPDLATFREQLSAYRNALASQKGYQRLEDTINGSEYRLGAFVGGFEAEPIGYSTSATFDLVFDCKPQRYLKAGELPVTIASGDKLTNPTLFESRPLIMARGYGDIELNDDVITINDTVVGQIQLTSRTQKSASIHNVYYADGMLNVDDSIGMNPGTGGDVSLSLSDAVISEVTINNTNTDLNVSAKWTRSSVSVTARFKGVNFRQGTQKSIVKNFTASITYRQGTSPEYTATVRFTAQLVYNPTSGNGGNFIISITPTVSGIVSLASVQTIIADTVAYSTISTLGDPTYIDLEIGEAYKMVNGEAVSLNNSVSIGGTLPTLAVGENVITYPSTITSLEVVPRWWRV